MTEPVSGFYALMPGADFAEAFAIGFHDRFRQQAPRTIAETLVLTNSSRTQRLIEEALADTAQRPGPLPRIQSISQLYADPVRTADTPNPISPMRRQLRLTRLVEAYLTNRKASGEPVAPISAAPELAQSLTLLIDQMHDEGIAPETIEKAIAEGDLADGAASHWQQNLTFIDIVRAHWPAILAEQENGAVDLRASQYLAIEALLQQWKATPPTAPVIAVGSTGSVGSTAKLLLGIAALPHGAVVLPGFDPELDPDIWKAVTADHPMGPFHRWMDAADIQPAQVQTWHTSTTSPRNALVAQALRPAPVTDHWHAAADALRPDVADATRTLSLIEADSPRLEASAIAIAIRQAVDLPDHHVTLITPDAALARRVTAQLTAFGIVPDDTSGQPLSQTPPGILMQLVLLASLGKASAVEWAALLSHPLVQPGLHRNDHLAFARLYERKVLREVPHVAGQTMLPAVPQPVSDRHPELPAWVDGINRMIAPFTDVLIANAPLGELLKVHVATVETLTGGPDDAAAEPRIWDDSDQKNLAGPPLKAFFQRLKDAADAFGDASVSDYAALLRGLMRGETLRPRPREPHPRVAIRGPREARIEAADTVILAGLNEATWPEAPDPGPWLSRPMYEALGLPSPERSVGLSAHDFQQAICQPNVILSRARKIDGTPSVASRWLIRLQTLITGIGETDAWQAMQRRGDRYLDIAKHRAKPEHALPRATRPAPSLEEIPQGKRRMSVTQIELLIRDAYAVYAQRILKLSPLSPLGRIADARERGNVMHDVMEAFTQATPNWPGRDQAYALLLKTADDELARSVPQPDLRRVWRARIQRFANWFIDREDQRRRDATPLTPETRGEMVLDLPNGPFEISAKADRIDQRHDGMAAVYDYKTGTPPSKDQIGTFNHQLHLQAAILAAGGFKDMPALQATQGAYIGLTGAGEGGKETSPDDLAAELPQVMQRLHELLSAYDTGAPWTAVGRPERQAYESDFDHLSRRDEWSGEDSA